ncbi:MAG: dienelactone hydrolase family protein [Pseudomonadota bacterium]
MEVDNCRERTAIVLLNEIYGINRHISDMGRKFEELGFDAYFMNYLDGKVFGYEESEAAYSYFMDNVGFEKAGRVVLEFLKSIRNKYEKIYLVGYSIGATVAWLCSEEHEMLDGIVGYYGSRIRDFLDINPQVETLLFFPKKEKSFEIDELVGKLNNKDKINTMILEGMHGFADAYSPNYNKVSKEMSERFLIEFISKQTKFKNK